MKLYLSVLLLILLINSSFAQVEVVKGSGQSAVVLTVESKGSDLRNSFAKTIDKVSEGLKRLKISEGGPRFFKFVKSKGEGKDKVVTFQAGFPIEKKLTKLAGFEIITFPTGHVVQVEHTGSYLDPSPAYKQIRRFLKKNKQEATETTYLLYLSDAAKVSPPNQKLKIIMPLK